jgi:protein-S-isoprenylcysteine O-methyltransferase Ste14
MLGILVGMWSGPLMTVDRLVLVAGMSVYVIAGIVLEERDLLREFGEPYRAWRARTPMLVPGPGRRRTADDGRPR